MSGERPPQPKSFPPERVSGEQARTSGVCASEADELLEEVELTPEQQRRILQLFSELQGLNLYDLLGVPRGADKKEIKRAYHQRATEFHPDRFFRKQLGTFKAMMEAIVMRMTEAHDVLCSTERRAAHDAALQARRSSLVDAMIEEAAAEMAGSAAAALREEHEPDERIRVASTPTDPWEPSPPVTDRPAIVPEESQQRRGTLARRLEGLRRPVLRKK